MKSLLQAEHLQHKLACLISHIAEDTDVPAEAVELPAKAMVVHI